MRMLGVQPPEAQNGQFGPRVLTKLHGGEASVEGHVGCARGTGAADTGQKSARKTLQMT